MSCMKLKTDCIAIGIRCHRSNVAHRHRVLTESTIRLVCLSLSNRDYSGLGSGKRPFWTLTIVDVKWYWSRLVWRPVLRLAFADLSQVLSYKSLGLVLVSKPQCPSLNLGFCSLECSTIFHLSKHLLSPVMLTNWMRSMQPTWGNHCCLPKVTIVSYLISPLPFSWCQRFHLIEVDTVFLRSPPSTEGHWHLPEVAKASAQRLYKLPTWCSCSCLPQAVISTSKVVLSNNWSCPWRWLPSSCSHSYHIPEVVIVIFLKLSPPPTLGCCCYPP